MFLKNSLQEGFLWYHFPMKLIVWLGNPGEQYKNTRHNIGFVCVEAFVERNNFSSWKDSAFKSLVSEWTVNGEKILAIKPLTYMNLSGEAVLQIVNFYKIPLENILVLSDDIDMDFAKIRLRAKWSHGGQNGLKNIILRLWSDGFCRIKIGIGRHEYMPVSDWVLSTFSWEERTVIDKEIVPCVEEKITLWINDGLCG